MERDAAIADHLRAIRAARGLTLDALASASGVSRAMLSRVERGESSPTAGLLQKVCSGLGVSPATLLSGDIEGRDGPPLARRAEQPVWRDSGSGYLRRTVSPAGPASTVELVELELPPGVAVVLDALDRGKRDQVLWVIAGSVEVARALDTLRLDPGDRLHLALDGPTGFRGLGPEPARCALVVGRRAEGAG